MKLKIIPSNSFNKETKKQLEKIINFACNLLKKNNILPPSKVSFYNSFKEFINQILPEVKTYGYDKKTCEEIIKIALNSGTYGTINYGEDKIIEMNFNQYNDGEYTAFEFLELIIHESLHLHLSKKIGKDVNLLKFKFEGLKYVGNKKIIQFDEGYAEFMTHRILKGININKINKIKIPVINKKKPNYNQQISKINLEEFDKNFEKLLIQNRNIGVNSFGKKFSEEKDSEVILNFAVTELRKIL